MKGGWDVEHMLKDLFQIKRVLTRLGRQKVRGEISNNIHIISICQGVVMNVCFFRGEFKTLTVNHKRC